MEVYEFCPVLWFNLQYSQLRSDFLPLSADEHLNIEVDQVDNLDEICNLSLR